MSAEIKNLSEARPKSDCMVSSAARQPESNCAPQAFSLNAETQRRRRGRGVGWVAIVFASFLKPLPEHP